MNKEFKQGDKLFLSNGKNAVEIDKVLDYRGERKITKGGSTLLLFAFCIFCFILGNLFGFQEGWNTNAENTAEMVAEYNAEHLRIIRLAMCDNIKRRVLEENATINGIFFSDYNISMVWEQDRELAEIEETKYHERCHYLVKERPLHFC